MSKQETIKSIVSKPKLVQIEIRKTLKHLEVSSKIKSNLEKNFIKSRKFSFTEPFTEKDDPFLIVPYEDSFKVLLKVAEYRGKKQVTRGKDFRRFLVNHDGIIQLIGWYTDKLDTYYVYPYHDTSLKFYLQGNLISEVWFQKFKGKLFNAVRALNQRDLHLKSEEVYIVENHPVIGKLLANDNFDVNEKEKFDWFRLEEQNAEDDSESLTSDSPNFIVEESKTNPIESYYESTPIINYEKVDLRKSVCFKMWITVKNSKTELEILKNIFGEFKVQKNCELDQMIIKVCDKLDSKLDELSNEIEFVKTFNPETELRNFHEALKKSFDHFFKGLAYGS